MQSKTVGKYILHIFQVSYDQGMYYNSLIKIYLSAFICFENGRYLPQF